MFILALQLGNLSFELVGRWLCPAGRGKVRSPGAESLGINTQLCCQVRNRSAATEPQFNGALLELLIKLLPDLFGLGHRFIHRSFHLCPSIRGSPTPALASTKTVEERER